MAVSRSLSMNRTKPPTDDPTTKGRDPEFRVAWSIFTPTQPTTKHGVNVSPSPSHPSVLSFLCTSWSQADSSTPRDGTTANRHTKPVQAASLQLRAPIQSNWPPPRSLSTLHSPSAFVGTTGGGHAAATSSPAAATFPLPVPPPPPPLRRPTPLLRNPDASPRRRRRGTSSISRRRGYGQRRQDHQLDQDKHRRRLARHGTSSIDPQALLYRSFVRVIFLWFPGKGGKTCFFFF